MPWNPSPEVAVAQDAAKKLNAEVGVVVIYVNRDTLGMASYGHNKALCAEMGKLGDHLYEAAMEYIDEH
ncbi:hypothetical protein LCGC14_0298010 [marine sediment metagenome]|uniref:Uncharacterized protein n=1 Tax=marine sediment metagenome TaxID=412755 RepID=A0A0F9U878_9ZZZZ